MLAARNWCGYTSVYIDITPFANFGSDVNVIAVQVDAVAQEGWWYEGAGLYRHAWLVKRNPVHIETDGVYANPVRNPNGQWTIPVEVALYSSDKTPANVEVESTLFDPAGKAVVSGKTKATVDPLKESVAKFSLAVASPETVVAGKADAVFRSHSREAGRHERGRSHHALRIPHHPV